MNIITTHVITSAVQLKLNIWQSTKTYVTGEEDMVCRSGGAIDGQGGEEKEIKSPVTKCKVKEKRVFVDRRIVRERGEFSL